MQDKQGQHHHLPASHLCTPCVLVQRSVLDRDAHYEVQRVEQTLWFEVAVTCVRNILDTHRKLYQIIVLRTPPTTDPPKKRKGILRRLLRRTSSRPPKEHEVAYAGLLLQDMIRDEKLQPLFPSEEAWHTFRYRMSPTDAEPTLLRTSLKLPHIRSREEWPVERNMTLLDPDLRSAQIFHPHLLKE